MLLSVDRKKSYGAFLNNDSRGKLYATIIGTGYRDEYSGTSNQNKEYDESS